MKVWIAALALWYALLGAGFLVVRDVDSKTPPPPDWELAAACLWERFDPAALMEEQARQIRFCVTTFQHALPPGISSP